MSGLDQTLGRIRGITLSRRAYVVIAAVALGALAAIVLTGAAVRLTGSGLGCPDWPKCFGKTVPPGDLNSVIEYGNRIFTGIVGVTVIAACVLVWFRRPFRWHLALFGALLPLGVIGQAGLGALVVYYDLAPALVMGHFILSMLLLDAAFALYWCARYEPGERRPSGDWLGVWSVRALVPFGQLTVLLGTISTAAGPHPGDHNGELVHRFTFKGADTLQWMVERHAVIAALFGIAAIAVWLILRREGGDRRATRPVLVIIGLLGAQGVVGGVQWALELPALLVWVHIALATFTWLATLWAVGTAGRLRTRNAEDPTPINELVREAVSERRVGTSSA